MKKLYIAVALLIAGFIGYGIYGQMTKGSAKSKRLACQQKATTFERIYASAEALREAVKLLEARRYAVTASVEPSRYMKSRLFEYVRTEQTDRMLRESIETLVPKRETEKGGALEIDYLIYENDKEDPGKKSPKAKLYAGYLVFEFKSEGETLYKLQIDFMQPRGEDIPARIECAVRSFISLKDN